MVNNNYLENASYFIEREIENKNQKIALSKEELCQIHSYYKKLILKEYIEGKLMAEYDISDTTIFKDIIEDIADWYEKNRKLGCDEEHSVKFAFDEMHGEIESIMEKS